MANTVLSMLKGIASQKSLSIIANKANVKNDKAMSENEMQLAILGGIAGTFGQASKARARNRTP